MKEAVIHVYAFERPLSQRRAMVTKLTEAACEAYSVPAEKVTVYFFDVDPGSMGYAGELVADTQAVAAEGEPPPRL